jgi:DNA polymerase (family 10)
MGKKEEIAEIFYNIASILEIQNVQWKPAAYRKAARSLESLGEDIEDIYKEKGIKGLEEIPGIGERLAKKISEYIETGRIKEWEKLKKTLPSGFYEILKIPGMGVKKAYVLYKKLGIKNIKDLEKAVRSHKISKSGIFGFKEKTEENILQGLEFLKKTGKEERKLLSQVLPLAQQLREQILGIKGARKADIAGSLRRMKETIRDVDMLVCCEEKLISNIARLPVVGRVTAKGSTRASIVTKQGLQVDIRVVPEESYGSALQYFTGSKEHSIHLRKICIKKGLKLSEYGLFRGKKRIAGETEQEIYKALGLQYPEPELREDRGEIELAMKNKLPKILGYNEVLGDLHVHTNASDGNNTLQELAQYAKVLGRKYLAICDHGGEHLPITNALSVKELERQIKIIDKFNSKSEIFILKGAEVDILANGSLSLPDSILKKLDIVMASVHSGFKFPEEKMTFRVLKAMDNPYISVLGHPTGRIIHEREPYKINLEKIFEKARERQIALEINAFPNRLDLNDTNVKLALDHKCKFAIGTDSHVKEHLSYLVYGIAVARRGWATANDVLNAWPKEKLLKWLRR